MTEETTNSAVNAETTEKQATETFVPAWKIKADNLKKKLADNEQVFYESDQYFDCLPIARPKDAPNVFPFTSEEPTGFIAPKMDWGNRHWVETASIQQGKDIEEMKSQIAELTKTAKTVTAQQKNQNVETAQSSQLMMMITKQLGIMNTKLDNLADKIAPAKPTNVTTSSTPVAPTQSTTATPAAAPTTEGGAQ